MKDFQSCGKLFQEFALSCHPQNDQVDGNVSGEDFDLPFLLLICGYSFLILMTFQFHLHIQDHNGYNGSHR